LAFGDEFPYMALAEEHGAIVAVVLRTPPHWIHISYVENEAAIPLIVEAVQKVYETLPGVNGFAPFSRQFAESWQLLTGDSFGIQMSQGVYRLTTVNPVRGVAGAMRPVEEADRSFLRDWFKGFDKDAMGEEMTDAEANAAIDRRLNNPTRSLYIWENGNPVSMAGTSGPTPNGFRVNAVYTPPEHRGKGYASACVAALSQLMLDQGRRYCILFTAMGNSTSKHIYQTIGYDSIGIAELYAFDSSLI
jgi:predicted GNAT family acetyltransferase